MATKPTKPLTMQQLLFANEILLGATQAEAYKKAGYKAEGHSAEVLASRLLKKVELASYIEAQRERLIDRVEITVENVVRALWREGQSKLNPASARVSALGLVGKHLGVFQADRTNDADAQADLLRDIQCRFAIGLHVHDGTPLEEALQIAMKNPLQVEDWAVKKGLMQAVVRA